MSPLDVFRRTFAALAVAVVSGFFSASLAGWQEARIGKKARVISASRRFIARSVTRSPVRVQALFSADFIIKGLGSDGMPGGFTLQVVPDFIKPLGFLGKPVHRLLGGDKLQPLDAIRRAGLEIFTLFKAGDRCQAP